MSRRLLMNDGECVFGTEERGGGNLKAKEGENLMTFSNHSRRRRRRMQMTKNFMMMSKCPHQCQTTITKKQTISSYSR